MAAGFIWAVVLAEPVASPPVGLATRRGATTLDAELTNALADRRRLHVAVSRSRSPALARPAPPAPPTTPAPPPVVWPAGGQLTGWYGERRGPVRHPGMDIDGATGDPVMAAAAGRVVHAGPSPAGYAGYGTVVILDHGELTTIYAHLSKVVVKAGQDVVPGQAIGAIGTTGSVSGSHLHFEVRRGGAAVDPKGWLPRR